MDLISTTLTFEEEKLTPRCNIHIKNGKLWAIVPPIDNNNNKMFSVIFSNLNSPEPKLTSFTFPMILFSFVSPDGEYCLVTHENTAFSVISASSLQEKRYNFLPEQKIRSVAWLNIPPNAKPFVLLGSDKGTLTYINLNARNPGIPIIQANSQNVSPVLAISASYYENRPMDNRIRISYLQNSIKANQTTTTIYTFFASAPDFIIDDQSAFSTTKRNLHINPKNVFSENEYIGFINNSDEIILYRFNSETGGVKNPVEIRYYLNKTKSKDPQQSQPTHSGIFVSGDFLFLYESSNFTIYPINFPPRTSDHSSEYPKHFYRFSCDSKVLGFEYDTKFTQRANDK